MDVLDVQLLYMIADAERTGKQVSTWHLASQKTKSATERNKLDCIYRYRLEQLEKKGVVTKQSYAKGKQHFTEYHLNTNKIVCANGSLFILSNPITILACRYVENCPSQCHITLEQRNDKVVIEGCKLLNNASEDIRQLVYRHLQETEKP